MKTALEMGTLITKDAIASSKAKVYTRESLDRWAPGEDLRDSIKEVSGGWEVEDSFLVEVVKNPCGGISYQVWETGRVAALEDKRNRLRRKGRSGNPRLGELLILSESYLARTAFGFGEYDY